MLHDIIDNRHEKLVDCIQRILPTTERARLAVGYLFLSGLKPIRQQLEKLKEVRLLIGNTSNRETIETLAEGYKRLELLEDAAEEWRYQKRVDAQQSQEETAQNLRDAMALMDQSDEDEATVRTVLRLIQEQRLKVRVYTKGRLHAKAYIFDYGKVYDLFGNELPREEKGIAIVGSSNLTLSGISHNTELNVLVQGNPNHAELVRWFDELWNEAHDFDEALMREMSQSWAAAAVTPYDVYMKTLYELVKDRLEEEDGHEILFDDDITRALADFQKVAVRQAIQMIRDYGGCFAADVVGLGKSFIGAAVVKHFERTQNARPLIICPAGLVEMWERYNEVYQLNARVLSMGYLREERHGVRSLLEDVKYRDRDFVLIDESHHFRHSDTQRYNLLQAFTATGRKCLLLTATPRNKTAMDVYHQIKLFHPDDLTDLPIDPPNLREFFRGVENDEKRLQDVLIHLLIRRTRSHILRWYGFDAQTHQPVDPARFHEYRDGRRKAYILVAGKHQFFPKRELETVTYSIEDTYNGLYDQLRRCMGRPKQNQLNPPQNVLTYARYGLWHYVHKQKQGRKPYADLHQAGANLRGLIRILMFKRLESSVAAFRETLKRLLRIHQDFLKAMEQGIVPAGVEAQRILYESDQMSETELFDALQLVSGTYNIADFNAELLSQHIQQDIRILQEMLRLVEPITPDQDDKLQTLFAALKKKPLSEGKRLIFTQFADTARYLYENLVAPTSCRQIDVICSGDKSRERVVGRFAPKANPHYRFAAGETELNTVIATDVLAEGLNMQDCDKVINYDLHWNPVRLIQRFGRIDRIGSEHDRIYAYNFLPEKGIEKQLGLKEKLATRIAEIHETIGEDAAILDPSEQLNEEAMYAIYESKGEQLSLFEEQEEEPMDLNEAEEKLRQLRRDDPAEFERIANLRDGIRTGKTVGNGLRAVPKKKGIFAFFRRGRYQQLIVLDAQGNVQSRDLNDALKAIACNLEERAQPLPEGYNAALMAAKARFDAEAKQREAQREHTASLTQGQRYIIRELRALFNATQDDDAKRDVTILEETFRAPVTVAVRKELNVLRRNGVTGDVLLSELKRIYYQHNLKDAPTRLRLTDEERLTRIVCSEALV
jgi:superfamily II DNA/RNA helicase